MTDHGTKVQCPQCKEWVSGSHKCDIWTDVCPTCEGSGRCSHYETFYDEYSGGTEADCNINAGCDSLECIDSCPSCPTCTDGKVRLEVEEVVCDKCFQVSCIAGEVMCYESRRAGTTTRYRPMTKQEVEEYSKQWERRDIESIIAFVQAITKLKANDYYTYKGQRVRVG